MIQNKEKLRERFLRDPLLHRLVDWQQPSDGFHRLRGNHPIRKMLSACWRRQNILLSGLRLTEPEVAAEFVSIQTLINLWLKSWEKTNQNKEQRTLLPMQAKQWSDRPLDFSGLV